ncbi:ABC transporter substrate-binding protein [Bradyrhizobium diazoefficiens]|uniref:ABC transporter substrate-binding protein n=1 Tax=Bradyrhizobium diazoefficiens TaxID=1355477 RepID=UPI001B8B8196|nr:ABC transporter substrate-binding protein [Bradyrhizobium diazoefficiens]MBR0863501.1 ABC transporter substrate-binding protein [Bradyrhizobium diazoefficiens]MBR0888186.1 ABC transporter substrate-binding protein [Bradyrhizobium diazoefficiens]MBR0919827.1 ABC transporter substrate-binding protein [Bradyrhizobium diazoefficiens]
MTARRVHDARAKNYPMATRLAGGRPDGTQFVDGSICHRLLNSTVALVALALLSLTVVISPARAQKQYDPGASDVEVKLGQTMPYSGPASLFGVTGRIMSAYFRRLNEQGGVNGRKITFLSLDDGFSPPKTVEQTRRLVESDEVLAIVGSVGSPTNLAVAKYLNGRKVPQLLVAAGSPKLNNPELLPWTTTFFSSAYVETYIYAQQILKDKPEAKLAILYQDDDFGRNYLNGMKAALRESRVQMVAAAGHELSAPTIESQIANLKSSGADVLLIATTPKFAAQAIRKTYELNWTPMRFVVTPSAIFSVLKAAGADASKGVISSQWVMQAADPEWEDEPAMKEFVAFMQKWAPEEKMDDASATYAYSEAQLIVELIRRCGDKLTRENLLWQATHIEDYQLPLFVPGVKINVTPTSHLGWRQAKVIQFDGQKWAYSTDVETAPETATRSLD